MRLINLTLALLLLVVPEVYAAKLEGVTMPDNIKVEGKSLVLNGIGMREATIFNVDVYVAGLYLESKSNNAEAILKSDQVKRIHLVFQRDVDRDEMMDALQKAFDRNAGAKADELKGHMRKFKSWLQTMKEDTSLTFTHLPGKGLVAAFDGKVRGTIPNDDFARVILAGWLGKEVTDEDLREQLLGK